MGRSRRGSRNDRHAPSHQHGEVRGEKRRQHRAGEKSEAYICPTKSSGLKPADIVIPKQDNQVLKVNFVDVQQGDGAVIESPDGKIILVDGGDNQLFARYLAARFR